MDSHEEDGEIREEGRRHHHHHRGAEDQQEPEDDDFSMSSYDGDQGDSLDIKPPQAVVQRREKREKREKRDRHRHKGERHKDRHRNREHRSNHEERRREHRKHRKEVAPREGERREIRRHEKRHERGGAGGGGSGSGGGGGGGSGGGGGGGGGRHERQQMMDARTKIEKRKMMEREMERRREREHEEYYIDEREAYEQHLEYRREHQGRGNMGGGVGGGGGLGGEYATAGYGVQHHRRDDRVERAPLSQLSPRERAERDRRMERFLVADKQKELSQREAESRRQRREEERREEERRDEVVRHRGGGGLAGEFLGHSSSSSRHHSRGSTRSPPPQPQPLMKKRKHMHPYPEEAEEVTIVSDEEEEEEDEIDEEEEEEEEEGAYEEAVEVKEDEKKRKRKRREEERGGGNAHHSDSRDSGSSDSETDSDSDSSSSTETDVEEDKAEKTAAGREKGSDDQLSRSGSGTGSARSGTLSPSRARHYDDSPNMEGRRSDREEDDDTHYLPESSPESPVEMKEQLPSYFPAIMGCRSVDEFECLNRIEEGTYGVVYRAREKATNQIVALKRLKMEKEKEGFPITSLREVNTLLKGQHQNIVTVREIVVGSNMDKIYIVMDYVEHDLKSLMETMRQKKQIFTIGEIKTLMQQLLHAVHHLHDNWILHRDLKTSNLLLSHRGILKVGDFGLAREYGSPLKHYTPIVVTLWYRAPELLLGAKQYSTHIDVWSVGCIFGELLGMEPMFPGKSEIDQLNKIFKDLGTPSDKIWPGYNQLPLVKKTQFADYPYNHLRERFKTRLSDEGFNLLNRFLTYNPQMRITCQKALRHDYFHKEQPAPIDPAMFPTWPAKSENPHARSKKIGISPKPPSGGKNFKDLVDGDDDMAATGFFLGGAVSSGPGFVLKM
ncbi:cyclin-dependent kinase 11B-like isoform X2 [Eriocheir sinensis]|uniref:cyclin-dependent kinase 11B-like isoform X2 n=1 Tax=Eriocheir sinensis TaxID=95602 RepID=UPI0021C6A361|nr:cyclin-dependent kinase 11B-like isoform X2 [Eriocheir sinensis]